MAGNNSIQILRGNNVKSTAASEVLLDGQPLYDRTTGYLYVGENNTVANTQAVNAHYANTAGSASSATTAQQANYVKGFLYFNGAHSNGTTYNNSWDGRDTEVLYVPTGLGSTGQVWGMVNSNRAGWMDQTEIPGTIEHANTANVAYEVSGSNVSGSVANANYANYSATATTAGRVKGTLSLTVRGDSFKYNGVSNISVNNPSYNKRYDIVAYTTGVSKNGAVPYYDASYSSIEFASPTRDDKGCVLTYGGGSNVSWSPPVQLYAIEDLGSDMYIVFSSPFGSTDSISFFNSLTTKGYDSASNPFRVVYGVRGNKPIRAIYANTTTSMSSTRFTIMYLDDSTQFVSYNGTSSNPARITIHQLSHYQDLGIVQ